MEKSIKHFNKITGLMFGGKVESTNAESPIQCELRYSICFGHVWAEHEKLSTILTAHGYNTRDLFLYKVALDAKQSEMVAQAKQSGINVAFAYSNEVDADVETPEGDELVFAFYDELDAFFFRLIF